MIDIFSLEELPTTISLACLGPLGERIFELMIQRST